MASSNKSKEVQQAVEEPLKGWKVHKNISVNYGSVNPLAFCGITLVSPSRKRIRFHGCEEQPDAYLAMAIGLGAIQGKDIRN